MNVKSIGDFMYYTNCILGQGSFSITYKGYRLTDNMPIAVKKIHRVISQSYFKNEVALMKSLDHPNIVKLYDVIQQNNKIYMILEYCNGGDLSKYIRKKKDTYDDKYFHEILLGLKYLYDKQIMHRDIKPANFLIHEHTIKISDFGFAKSFSNNELSLTFCGSPLYMSPEILKHSPYTTKSDLWSLGVILYELIVKLHPYYVTEPTELMNLVNNGYNINISSIDNEYYRNIIKLLLEQDVNNRLDCSSFFTKIINEFKINNKSSLKTIPIPIPIKQIDQYDITYSNNNSPEIQPSSAPIPLNNHIVNSYLDTKMTEVEEENMLKGITMPIYGSSPELRRKSDLQHLLNHSVKSISNFFNFKL
jgi:serine/threonine-protein kinase ULK/ATG1